MRFGRLVIAIAPILAVTLAAGLVSPVFAHALPVRSNPDANAMLVRPPAFVEIYFSEAIDPSFSKIRVLDSSGRQIDLKDSKVDPADPTHLTVSLPSLNDGVYTVIWTVLSSSDGHQTNGSFPFAVGKVDSNALAAAQKTTGSTNLSAGEIITKALIYLAAALLAGGILFTLLVWSFSIARAGLNLAEDKKFQAIAKKLYRLALLTLVLAGFLSLAFQAGQAAGKVISFRWSPDLYNILFNTRFGSLAIARLCLAFTLAGFLFLPPSRLNYWAGFAISLILLLTISFESHAAADPQPVLPIINDWIHLTAASVWVGGLFLFISALRVSRTLVAETRTRLTASLIPKFSRLALASVGSLIVTGALSALDRIGTLPALLNSQYGQALIIKWILALPMVCLGALNLLVITPSMHRAATQSGGSPDLISRFRGHVLAEVILGVLLMSWVGVFTSLPPARIISTAPGFNGATQADDLKVSLSILPNRVGINTFTVKVTSNGQPVTNLDQTSLEFTALSGIVPFSKTKMVGTGNGVFTLKGAYLGTPDKWNVQVVVQRKNRFDAYSSFDIDLTGNPPQSIPWNKLSAGLLIASAISFVTTFRFLDHNTTRWLVAGLLPGLVLAMISIIIIAQPTPATAVMINPVAPDTASITRGQVLYQQNCNACHGPSGKGDGPVGLTLNPRPADLSQHAIPGVHTDGQLYEWITNGFPNSAMPAFSENLSDQDRWDLVNFIRTLAPK
jgi:copper transport protein